MERIHQELATPPNREEEKKKAIERIVEGSPDAIFVISGDIVPNSIEGREDEFRSPGYADLDYRDLITGGRARVIASSELARCFPAANIITTSYALGKEDRPTHASVMARELRELGIEDGRIILEEKSYNTLTELQEMVQLIFQNKWKSVAVVTSDYHIPRMELLFEKLKELSSEKERDHLSEKVDEALRYINELGVVIQFVSAEDILPIRSSHYAGLISKVRETDAYKLRVQMEQKGVEQLKEGTYGHS